jgi:hypothetical protein
MRIEVFGQSIPDCDKTLHVVLAQAVDLPHAKTQREFPFFLVMPAEAGIQ